MLFATGAGGTDYDYGHGIAVDPDGNSLVTGFFDSLATFDADGSNETTLESAGLQDIFVARYAPDGTLLWVRRAGGGSGDVGYGIAVDAPGNSLVTGDFEGAATFGAGELNETTLESAGWTDIFWPSGGRCTRAPMCS